VRRSTALDRSLKTLIRRAPGAFFRLAGITPDPRVVRPGDVSVNVAEFRADQVFIVGEEGDPKRWALHLEYQLQPDARVMPGWFFKNAALTVQLKLPVVLVVVYLGRGRRTSFPETYQARGGGLENEYRFHSIRLWEHAERIRSGEVAELAPLLVLCEEKPSEATVLQERELLLGLDVPPDVRADLLAVAIGVGARYFSRDLLRAVFREELQMLRGSNLLDELVEQWGEERLKQRVEQQVQGVREEGREEGRLAGLREAVLRQLGKRFGELPTSATARIQTGDAEWCGAMLDRIPDAKALADLGL
jgi:predicted transposase YdaD